MIRALLIEPEGTLFLPNNGAEVFFREQAARWGDAVATDRGDEARLASGMYRLYLEHPKNPDRLYGEIVREFGLPLAAARLLAQEYAQAFPRGPQLRHEARATLGRLNRLGYRLGIVAEGTVREQAARLESARLIEFLDTILITEAQGRTVLDRELLEQAIGCLGVSRGETLYVGASRRSGFEAAREAGITSLWIGDSQFSQPDNAAFRACRFAELPEMLDLVETLRAAS